MTTKKLLLIALSMTMGGGYYTYRVYYAGVVALEEKREELTAQEVAPEGLKEGEVGWGLIEPPPEKEVSFKEKIMSASAKKYGGLIVLTACAPFIVYGALNVAFWSAAIIICFSGRLFVGSIWGLVLFVISVRNIGWRSALVEGPRFIAWFIFVDEERVQRGLLEDLRDVVEAVRWYLYRQREKRQREEAIERAREQARQVAIHARWEGYPVKRYRQVLAEKVVGSIVAVLGTQETNDVRYLGVEVATYLPVLDDDVDVIEARLPMFEKPYNKDGKYEYLVKAPVVVAIAPTKEWARIWGAAVNSNKPVILQRIQEL